jgi:hypothetical protein
VKDIVELFERNSTIKGSVDNATMYVIPVYYYDPGSGYGDALIASLIIEKDQLGYTVKIGLEGSGLLKASNREEAKKLVDEKFGRFVRHLRKAVSTKHPLAIKLTELVNCLKGIILINFLSGIYGDDILNDSETISGIHRACFLETRFFANDKVIAIPDIYLWVVRDTRSNKIFKYSYKKRVFYRVLSGIKIFYDALFRGYRDLLKPEDVVEGELGYRYALSSTEVEVDGKKVSLVVYGGYDAKYKEWYIHDVIAITCDESGENKCSIYSFIKERFLDNIDEIEDHAILGYILRSGRIHGETRGHVAKDIAEKHTWEILPA